MEATIKTKSREATPEEYDRMNSWVRWLYDRNQAVALWIRGGHISLIPENMPLNEVSQRITLLQKGA